MRIADLFGGNKTLAVIGVCAQCVGSSVSDSDYKTMEKLCDSGTMFLVFLQKSGVHINAVKEKSDRISRLAYNAMSFGKVVLVRGVSVTELTRRNWWEFVHLFEPKEKREPNDRIRVPRREQTAFDECQPERTSHKFSRRGFLCTHIANESMERLAAFPV